MKRYLSLVGAFTMLAVSRAAQAQCTLNGQDVPCEDVSGAFGMFALIAIPFAILGIALFIFWIMMIVHAATKPIENKAVWILVLVFFQGLGAIVYYFAVKRPFDLAAKTAAGVIQK